MNPRVKDVRPNNDYTLRILFTNGEEKIFDMKPYLDTGVFLSLLFLHCCFYDKLK
jgi:hypothetical protein